MATRSTGVGWRLWRVWQRGRALTWPLNGTIRTEAGRRSLLNTGEVAKGAEL